MHTETPISSETVFTGRVIDLTVDTVRLENGRTATREVVHHNGGAGIVALDNKGNVALVRQYRYPAGREVVEIPAGKVEKGEAPLATAQRELTEEAGLTAAHWQPFGAILPTCAYDNEVISIFLATGLAEAEQNLDEDEFLSVFWMPLAEAVEKVLAGEIIDGKTVAGLLRAEVLRSRGELPLG